MSKYRLFVDAERRLANFNNAYGSLADLPDGATQQIVGLTTSDGAATVGVLHTPKGGSRVCAFYMHPRTNQTRPYLTPSLLESKIAVWGQMSRHVNNDTDMTHEEVLLDAAAGMRYLRERGFQTIIAIGNSGGSSLLAYYQAQASRAPAERQPTSPAGEPTGFATEDMPPFDLYIALALHLGEGAILLTMLDPSVVNEADPIAIDPDLDMYSSRNGYRNYPQSSCYDHDWLVRYRVAQRERCHRLDMIAHSLLQDYQEARALADPARLDSATARRATFARIMLVHRTWANPNTIDLSLSPSRRPIGGVSGEHPVRMNFGYHGPARILTPRAWLSTWSGLSSRAELRHTIPEVRVPSLFIWPDGDYCCFPEDVQAIMAASPATTKDLTVIEWSQHYLTPVPNAPDTLSHPKIRAGEAAVNWIRSQIQ